MEFQLIQLRAAGGERVMANDALVSPESDISRWSGLLRDRHNRSPSHQCYHTDEPNLCLHQPIPRAITISQHQQHGNSVHRHNALTSRHVSRTGTTTETRHSCPECARWTLTDPDAPLPLVTRAKLSITDLRRRPLTLHDARQ